MKNKNKTKDKNNSTKNGEFVCSEYEWLPIGKQKEKAQKMEDITKQNKNKSK